jgi:hypothetical protein
MARAGEKIISPFLIKGPARPLDNVVYRIAGQREARPVNEMMRLHALDEDAADDNTSGEWNDDGRGRELARARKR